MAASFARVRVPATSANLGPGFDCLGMALNLEATFELCEGGRGQWDLEYLAPAPDPLPPTDGRNLVARAAERVFQSAGATKPASLTLRIQAGWPLARGLGSSAAAIVGGMFVAYEYLGQPFSKEQLLLEMVAMEGHPDNVVPCFLGGLTSSLQVNGKVRRVRVEPHPSVRCVLFIPGYALSTAEARRAIPKTIPHADATFNMSRVPLVFEALKTGDLELLKDVLEDRLHEPYRRPLVKSFGEIADAAASAGAHAVALSGAGPTQIAFCSEVTAPAVHAAWTQLAHDLPFDATILTASPDLLGAVSIPA